MARGIAAAAVAIATIATIAAVAARRVRVDAELVRTQDAVMERVATPAPMTHAMTSPAPPATAQPAASMRTKTVEERARPARTRRGARPAKATTKPAAATAKAPAATEPAKSTWDPDSMYLPGQR